MGLDEDIHATHPVYNSLYAGFVTDREDPLKLGRVRVKIPGLFDQTPFSNFAWPMGMAFGGAKQRGLFMPPVIGAAVTVQFYLGDLNQPFYMPANWGEGEVPTGATVDGEDAGNYPLETKAWLIEVDDRTTDEIRVTNKATGDSIVFEGTARKATLTMKDAVVTVDGVADKIKAEATNVELGKVGGGFPALRVLIDSRIIALFNAHTHLGNLGAPTSNPQVSVPPTILTTGEGTQGVSTTRTKGN